LRFWLDSGSEVGACGLNMTSAAVSYVTYLYKLCKVRIFKLHVGVVEKIALLKKI